MPHWRSCKTDSTTNRDEQSDDRASVTVVKWVSRKCSEHNKFMLWQVSHHLNKIYLTLNISHYFKTYRKYSDLQRFHYVKWLLRQCALFFWWLVHLPRKKHNWCANIPDNLCIAIHNIKLQIKSGNTAISRKRLAWEKIVDSKAKVKSVLELLLKLEGKSVTNFNTCRRSRT